MLIRVLPHELLDCGHLAYDLFTGTGSLVLRAGEPLAGLDADMATTVPLFRNPEQYLLDHEGVMYHVPMPNGVTAQPEAHRLAVVPPLVGTETASHWLKSMRHFWGRLEEGKPADMALLEVVRDAMVAELVTRVDQVLYLSQLRVRDGFTYCHTMDVAAMSIALATAHGLDRASIQEVGLAAILHDLGKLLIPKHIMFKSGRLTEKEFEVMKLHPELGYRILRHELKLPDPICRPALEHQEMWSGGGYPLNLKGEEIHLYSQIVKIADVYDALTSRRPYKEPIPSQKALEIMRAEGAKGFNPKLLETFCKLSNFQECAPAQDAPLREKAG